MNVSYRTNFILRIGIPLYLFISYFFISHSKLTLIIAILATIHLITFGLDVHRKGKWNKINLQHDQRTRDNALFAGNLIYWFTILVLLLGTLLIQNSMISITYPKLVGYLILISLLLKWIIRDYLNNRVESED
ncbi:MULTISPECIES: hypothetical protein [unclassified Lysinibacillus]|uniref:hypothetical protein n=1 Tax=unclassified Lysinibacillus TaxID=2636778 RepID=UPI0020110778|nr:MULTISPECIES: hypothetical protein [unclassified Lysinibacillus]MCL1696729.1 hypothetical protein [Lysinibacillus sp. BPa_S21]MCL1702637.1 hypothetical protein [Lysinibacillus sp. Bpr_S20]